MQRVGNRSWRQPAGARRQFHELVVERHSLGSSGSPGYLDRIPETPKHDIREQTTLTCGVKCVPEPPRLPRTFPLRSLFFIIFYCPGRESSGMQGFPCGVSRVLHWKAFFVQQGIPVIGEPLEERKKIPMNRIDSFAFLQVSAQVPAFHPDLKPPPGKTGLEIDATSSVGIGGKRHFQRERTRVAGEPLPSGSHPFTPSASWHPFFAHALPSAT